MPTGSLVLILFPRGCSLEYCITLDNGYSTPLLMDKVVELVFLSFFGLWCDRGFDSVTGCGGYLVF